MLITIKIKSDDTVALKELSEIGFLSRIWLLEVDIDLECKEDDNVIIDTGLGINGMISIDIKGKCKELEIRCKGAEIRNCEAECIKILGGNIVFLDKIEAKKLVLSSETCESTWKCPGVIVDELEIEFTEDNICDNIFKMIYALEKTKCKRLYLEIEHPESLEEFNRDTLVVNIKELEGMIKEGDIQLVLDSSMYKLINDKIDEGIPRIYNIDDANMAFRRALKLGVPLCSIVKM